PTEKGHWISAGSSTKQVPVDEKKGVTRGWCYPAGWYMEPIGENKTKIYYLIRTDLKA
ncbi:MAG: hypothetical protein EZS28_053975, partial [Streblomastix strix]